MEREAVNKSSNSQGKTLSCAPSALSTARALQQTQQIMGNRAWGTMIQAKLKVSEPGDASEQEADLVADRVMQMSESHAHEGCVGCNGKSPCAGCSAVRSAQSNNADQEITPQIQRQLNMCDLPEESMASDEEPSTTAEDGIEEEPIQRSAEGGLHASSNVAKSINASKGKGEPLPQKVRDGLGGKMGADFSRVRIHTDSRAVQMNKDLGAHAFTHGPDVYFNVGKYDPESREGQHLLAHELTHTIQQNDRAIHRLAVTVQAPLAKGTCGQYSTRWIFALDNPAPEDGYIIQQIDEYKEVLRCPSMGRCLVRPTQTFWEAWFVRRGDTHEHLHASMGFTDQDSQRAEPRKVGYNVGTGEIKFFKKSVTGDLGKDGTAPATPNGGWGPGNAPLSGSLPSTTSPPSWWGNAPTEGPATRLAYAAWRCCNDSHDFNVIKTSP